MSPADGHAPRAGFTSIETSTAADWQLIAREFGAYARQLPDRLLAHLKLLEGDFGGFPIDSLSHCLQTATRAEAGGEDERYIVCALLHDIGDTLGTWNHPDVAAALLKPFVSEADHWMVAHHGIFQGYYFFHHLGMDRDLRERFRDSPHFARTERFCALYDSPAFDPAAETRPLAHFEPILRRVFAEPVNSIYRSALD